MDSLLVEALAETRRVLDDLHDVPLARRLGRRREALERAASIGRLESFDRAGLIRIARLVVDLRDEAVELQQRRRVVVEALREAMD
jgi:hypothetical protein